MTNQFESAQVESSQVGDAAGVGAAVGQAAAESAANSFRQLVESDNIENSGTVITNQDSVITKDEVNQMRDSGKSDQLPNLEIKRAEEVEKDWKKESDDNNRIFDGKDEEIKILGDEDFTKGAEISNRILDALKKWEPEVSDKDRKKAKEVLSDEISDLVPKEDQKALRDMQAALVDGDLEAFGKAVKDASSDPEKLKMLVKELNKQLSENEGFGGIDVHVSGGNVFMYEEGGDTALKIDSKTGEASIHPIERREDGSVVMTPGEIINREPSDVMQSVADEATRSITGKTPFGILKGDKFPMPKPRPPFDGDIKPYYDKPGRGKGGGGGGGKDHSGPKWDFLKRGALGAMKSFEE